MNLGFFPWLSKLSCTIRDLGHSPHFATSSKYKHENQTFTDSLHKQQLLNPILHILVVTRGVTIT